MLDVAEKRKKNEDEVELSPMGAVEEDLAPVVCLRCFVLCFDSLDFFFFTLTEGQCR